MRADTQRNWMETRKLHSACALNCPDICAYIVHIEEGRIVRLEGDPEHPYTLGRCCPKGYGHVLRTYSEGRLQFPMKKQKNGEFLRVTWEEALDDIAAAFNCAKEEFGPHSVGIYSGSGNDGLAPKYAARYANAFGCRMIPGIVEICFQGAYEGARFNVGPFPPHELSDWANSKCILVWGTNKYESSIHCKRVIDDAIDAGAKLVVIDPRRTPHAKRADIYTTIRPGTDAALALGMAKVIIEKELHNVGFIEKHVYGFEQYRERAREYDLKTVSEITWVDENVIEEMAVMFATHGPGLIMTAPAGMNHYTNGTWAARAVHSLLAICGYLGLSGSGFQYLSSDNSPFNGPAVRLDYLLDESVQPVVPSGTYIPEFVLSQEESPLQVLVIQAANPMTQWPNTEKTRSALRKIPFKVCIDQMMTDTARHCDIVLPATTLFEHDNLVHSELHRIVQYSPKLVEPQGEAKHELEIWKCIAEQTGLESFFQITERDAIRLSLESDDCRHITLEKLKQQPEGIRTSAPAIPFAEGDFGTRSGKVELYSDELEELGYDPLPFHEEPAESPMSTPDVFSEYPLIMITGRLRERLHSQFTALEVGATVTNYVYCTSCQKCVKDCPDEAISLRPPSPEEMAKQPAYEEESRAEMRSRLGALVRGLAVRSSGEVLRIPNEMTGLLIPEWDIDKCIGCRECNLDLCPYNVITEPIRLVPEKERPNTKAIVVLHPQTADSLGLVEDDSIYVESRRGRVDNVRLKLSEGLDPRIIWASDGWWNREGNMNLLTDDRYTSFGHTPGFNSVLVRVGKSNTKPS
ncbi:MAG: molybdopterin-dependent oxidoreductase [Candidatus Thorarchaeota archaeon]|nr:MAG: molybdopterin-dependent oxidoreductase [Candidatus Thorarchaeota archaeon]